jgi:ABC-type multidrug transport system fused ATPase/permease subunit
MVDIKIAAENGNGHASSGDPTGPTPAPVVPVPPPEETLLPPVQFKGVPEEDAWFWSRLFFTWMRPLFRRAAYLSKHQSALEQVDLLPLPRIDHGAPILCDFERSWAATEKSTTGSITGTSTATNKNDGKENQETDRIRKAAMAVMGVRFIVAGVIKFINSSLQFSFPILIRQILKFIEESQAGKIQDTDPWHERYRGYWLSALLFIAMGSKAATENAYFHRVMRGGYQLRVAISIMVYNKALRLANSERQATTLGELVNLMQVDATKIEMVVQQIHVLWDGILQILGYMTILYILIGWPCFAGFVVMLAAVPIQGVIMQRLFALNRQLVVHSDVRVKKTNEALQGIQSVKMFAWEENFAADVNKSRFMELSFLKRVAFLRGFSRAYITSLPGLVAVTSFVVYALAYSGAEITASTLFAALIAFDQLRFPLMFYPMALAQIAQASVSAGRVQKFLGMKEVGSGEQIGDGKYLRSDEGAAGIIEVADATVFWSDPSVPLVGNTSIGETTHSRKSTGSKDEKSAATELEALEGVTEVKYPKPVLQNVSLSVKPGELCAVVGRVGSGKSTLCSAILNETLLQKGSISLKGKVAYASQSPWILNASLRDNILFGRPMDQERYNRVLQVCQLAHDLNMLDDGDLTEIGEKGINLSGGQKQRVSVARAAYADADVVILDDPLSALDPEVGQKLFDECILEFMAGKTSLLITNQLQVLKFCDTVVALRHGRVIEQGNFSDLIANESGEVSRLLRENAGESGNSNARQAKQPSKNKKDETAKKNDPATKAVGSLVTKEERAMGAVPLSVYRKYFVAGGGLSMFAVAYIGFILSGLNGLASVAWISYWTTDAPEYDKHPKALYLSIFAALSVSLGVFTFLRYATRARDCVLAGLNSAL